MHAPTTATEVSTLTPAQQEAQATIERQDYIKMLREGLPTLKSEYRAAEFMLAELTRAGDVQVKKKQFMKSAGAVTGGMPPMTEVALRLIAAQKRK